MPNDEGGPRPTLTGKDLNYAARVVFAEATGSGRWAEFQNDGGGIYVERDAIASVLYNRIGRSGFPDKVKRTTLTDVANAPNAFEPITTLGKTTKFDSSDIASGAYKNLSIDAGDCSDLTGSVDAIRRLVNLGPKYPGYTRFVGDRGRKGTQGTRHGGSRFW